MASIEIYYADLCGLCHTAMDYFRENGIEFTAHRLEWDPQENRFKDSPVFRQLVERCGRNIDVVPQFFVNDRWISGWAELEPMIRFGELKKLLQGV